MANEMRIESLGKVAVLMGGTAAERPVSLKSGAEVEKALQNAGVQAEAIDVTSVEQLLDVAKHYDRAFNVVHGRWGEDGGIQAVLDALKFTYTGSGMAASALAMDKLRTKWLWQGAGLPTPPFIVVSKTRPFKPETFGLQFPVIVKPVHEGSSIGMQKVESIEHLEEALENARQYDAEILVEQWVTGAEYTCGILGVQALPLIKLETPNTFYDFDAKYQSNTTQYICPCGLPADQELALQELCLQAFETIGALGWGRIDLMTDQQGNPWLIELNTVPGMTDHSLLPMAAKAKGLDFEQLVLQLLFQTLEND